METWKVETCTAKQPREGSCGMPKITEDWCVVNQFTGQCHTVGPVSGVGVNNYDRAKALAAHLNEEAGA